MVTICFEFNEEAAKQKGYDVEREKAEIQEYFQKNGGKEKGELFFELEGEDAMCIALSYVVRKNDEDVNYLHILSKCIADIDGEEEDCIKELFEWNESRGIA